MRKSTTRKKHRLLSRRSKYKRSIWTLERRFSNRNKEERSSIIYIDRKKDKRRNNSENSRKESRICSPYRSGERGSNENANRLIRRFIPKGIDITPISEEYIQKIEDWINNYPRTMFNYKSTNEILIELCA